MATKSSESMAESIKNISKADRTQYAGLWFLDHVFGRDNVNKIFSKEREKAKERLIKNVSKEGKKARVLEIERVDGKNITLKEFKEKYLKEGVPVVLSGAAADWPCVKNWKPEFIADKYGDDEVSLIDASPAQMNNINYKPETTTLRDVIMTMDDGPIKKYSRFNRILHEHPELKKDFNMMWLLLARNFVSSGQTFQVFIGGKGTKTHIHCAAEHNIFIQVYGRKHWVIYPPEYDCALQPEVTRTPYFHTAFDPDHPDYEKYPAMEYLDRYECTLEAGDILFNPPSYWHHVTNLSGSIGVGFRWFAPDCFKIDFMQALLTVLSVNPPIWTATEHRTNFPKIFSYMNERKKK